MISYPYSSRKLSDWVLATVSTSVGFPVGDNVAPRTGGWVQGKPNVGKFTPYAVLSGQGGTPAQSPLGASKEDWDTTFGLGSYGGTRDQAEWVSDWMKGAMCALNHQAVDLALPGQQAPVDWKVIQVVYRSFGGVERIDTVDPPYWQVRDIVGLRITV